MNNKKMYEIITDQILDSLKLGKIPWQKPWNTERPKNLVSKKEYRGMNIILLGMQNYSSPYWVTYKQAKQLGGNVRKGQKGSMIVFWKFYDSKETETETDGKTETKTTTTKRRIPLLRYYKVFNSEQCDNIETPKIEKRKINTIQSCEKLLKGYKDKPPIEKSSKAYYSPLQDKIGMPDQKDFIGDPEYYHTLFHEVIHSTGSENRLKRKEVTDINFFGSHEYSKEELTAEIGSAFLSFECGIRSDKIQKNETAYIQSWISVLQNDPQMIMQASGKAQKAIDYIKGISFEE